MHVLIAPNAFKHSLNAEEAALAIQEGLSSSKLNCICECFPIGDGGDGTGDLIIKKCNGSFIVTEVVNPLGKQIKAAFGLIDNGKTAVIEMANASGLRLLKTDELNPLKATSFGTGQQIKYALEMGVNKIILCMGGSATVDGGSGILEALGITFLNELNEKLVDLPASLIDLVRIDVTPLDQRILSCELIILCDVDNKLLGEFGAASIFGPQKGASPDAVIRLEEGLSKLAEIIARQFHLDITYLKYGGTAGGAAAGLHALLNAKLVNGIDYFLKLTEFDKALAGSDLVITGEGSIDEQTLKGKGPKGVAEHAKLKGLPVLVLAGKVPLSQSGALSEWFDVLLPIGNEPSNLEIALNLTKANLIRTAKIVGDLLALELAGLHNVFKLNI